MFVLVVIVVLLEMVACYKYDDDDVHAVTLPETQARYERNVRIN